MPIVVETFDNATVTVNPGPCCFQNLADSHNGLYAGNYPGNTHIGNGGPNPGCPGCANANINAMEIEYTFNAPIPVASKVRLWNNGGGDLFDQDGFASFDYEVYDNLNVLVGSGTMIGVNGFNPTNSDFGIAQNIQRLRIFNFQTLIPNVTALWWREIELLVPDIDCAPATNITRDSATLNWTGFEVSAGNFYQVRWGTDPDGPFPFGGTLVPTDGNDPDPTSLNISNLEPGTTYFYQVCVLDGDGFAVNPDGNVGSAQNYNVFPICEVCSFTTLPAESWCGGEYDPGQCVGVDIDGDGDDDYQRCLFI